MKSKVEYSETRYVFQPKQTKIKAQSQLFSGIVVRGNLQLEKSCRMRGRMGAILLVLVSAWTLQAEPLDPEPVVQTQENFDLGKVSLK